ncbi:MAG: exodeoxyribonuclease VII large subunit [Gammaproteobacteria bacterium]
MPLTRPPSRPPVSTDGGGRDVYTPSRLNREVRTLVERRFPILWLEGEISNLSRPASGHMYFSLKDAQAQIRCAMFRARNVLMGFVPADGMHVLVRGRASLYEPRGEFQLIVEYVEPAGEGALRMAYEQLKRSLAAEGLFDAARKRPLPQFAGTVGVVTSPTGAAIRDIVSVLRRRQPGLPIIVYPVPVQGAGAAEKITAMLGRAARRSECDVLILARGGGSLEDLWAFNDERLARAIVASPIPIVTGVGHEIDFTIADFAADVRAPTPSAAAELVSQDARELMQRIRVLRTRLVRGIVDRLGTARIALAGLEPRLVHPGRRLEQLAQRLDDLNGRLRFALRSRQRDLAGSLAQLQAHLRRASPAPRIAIDLQRLAALRAALDGTMRERLLRRHAAVDQIARALDAISPLATLGRGYAIVRRRDDRRILRDATAAGPGDRLNVRLARGEIDATVEAIRVPADDA